MVFDAAMKAYLAWIYASNGQAVLNSYSKADAMRAAFYAGFAAAQENP